MGSILLTIFISIVSSIIAGFLFWLLSFRKSFAKVVFSNQLEHSCLDGNSRTRFQIANVGKHDLIDVEMIAIFEMVLEELKSRRYVLLRVGDSNKLPLLKGRKRAYPYCRMYKIDLFVDQVTLEELVQGKFPAPIRCEAIKKETTLDSLFEYYGDKSTLQIFVCGTDSVSGARKTFVSPLYKSTDVIDGTFLQQYDYPSVWELKKGINVVETS